MKDKNSAVVSSGTAKERKRSKRKKHPLTLALIIMSALTIIIMITMALFTSFDEVTNRFNGGRVDIVLTEPHWKPEKALNVVPDAVLDKDPYITNNEEVPVYVFLKVTVPYSSFEVEKNTPEVSKGAVEHSKVADEKIPFYKFVVTDNNNVDSYDPNFDYRQSVHDEWIQVGNVSYDGTNKTITYVYGYKDSNTNNKLFPLIKGASTTKPLFDKIRVLNFDNGYDTNSSGYSIKVEAYGIQMNYLTNDPDKSDDPETVWNVITSNS